MSGKFVIVGIPKRLIEDNKVNYVIPVKILDNDGNLENEIKYLTVTEKDMMEMLTLAKERFGEDIEKAYA